MREGVLFVFEIEDKWKHKELKRRGRLTRVKASGKQEWGGRRQRDGKDKKKGVVK